MDKRIYGMLPMTIIGITIVLMTSCVGGRSDVEEGNEADTTDVDLMGLEELDLFAEETIPKSADELFDDFLYSYVSNSEFRRQRTAYGVRQFIMDDEMPLVVIYDREEDLQLQKDTSVVRVVMEQIEWTENTIHRYEFNRKDDMWMLTSMTDDDIMDTPNASFLVFLRDFMTDSLYRNESLRLPLTMNYYSEEDEGMVEMELTYDEWTELFADLPDMTQQLINIDYGQPQFSENRKSLQLQGLSNGLFLTFHFDFTDSHWCLIAIES